MGKAVENGFPGFEEVPALIIAAERRANMQAERKSLAHVVQNMWLKATALGLGLQLLSVIEMLSERAEFSELPGMSYGEFTHAGCIIGYPAVIITDIRLTGDRPAASLTAEAARGIPGRRAAYSQEAGRMASVNLERLGEAQWNRKTTWMFISFVLGLTLESYVFSLASIAIYWVSMPKALGELLLAWAPIWLIVGIILSGPFSDRYGRKITLFTTLALYAVGGIVLFFSTTYVAILVSLALMLIAGGGEMNSIMVASHELMPRKHRGKASMMIINGINFGGTLLAVLALLTSGLTGRAAMSAQRDVVAIAVLVVVAILFATRLSMPESFLWLEKKGATERFEKTIVSYFGAKIVEEARAAVGVAPSRSAATGRKASSGYTFFTMVIMIVIAAANTIGFGLMAYALAFAFFPHLQPDILAIFEGSGLVIGMFGLFADRVSRKKFLFYSFLGTFIMTVIVGVTTKVWQHDMTLFWILLVILAGINSLCYLTEDTIKPEVWPTMHRGTFTALARFISIGLYIPSIYITANMTPSHYIFFNAGVWLVGTLAAGAWYVWGHETGKGLSIQVASTESPAATA